MEMQGLKAQLATRGPPNARRVPEKALFSAGSKLGRVILLRSVKQVDPNAETAGTGLKLYFYFQNTLTIRGSAGTDWNKQEKYQQN